MKKIAFIVTKPQELLVAMAILEQLKSNNNICIFLFVNCFFGADIVFQRLTEARGLWDSALYFESYNDVLKHCERSSYDEISFDGDVGFKRNIQLLRLKFFSPHSILTVYEEGLGVYRNNFYFGLKKFIFKFLGVGINFGGHWLSSKIYLFEPEDYLSSVEQPSREVVEIDCSIINLFVKKNSLLSDIFGLGKLNKIFSSLENSERCDIYLTNWSVDSEFLLNLEGRNSFRILKLHPRLPKDGFVSKESPFFVCPQSIPAELLILTAMAHFNDVVVIHHGSSAARYLNDAPIKFELL